MQALFEGLTTFDAKGHAQPGMAESWTISDDKRVYTFRIRDDAKWSDGTPITAQDFVDSWKRTLTPETASSYNYQLFYVKNAQAFAEGKITDFSQVGVKALDPRTLQVTLENRRISSWSSAPRRRSFPCPCARSRNTATSGSSRSTS